MRALYDVNALLALLDKNHDSHNTVSSWFEANIEHGWASCPLTQNGYLRIVSQARYPRPRPLAEACEQLSAATSTQHHLFIPDDVSLLDDTLVRFRHLSGPRQLTDVYLLALAVVHDAQLVTLDTHIPLNAVHRAKESNIAAL